MNANGDAYGAALQAAAFYGYRGAVQVLLATLSQTQAAWPKYGFTALIAQHFSRQGLLHLQWPTGSEPSYRTEKWDAI